MTDVIKKPCPDRLEAIESLACGIDVDSGLRKHLLVCPGCNAYYRQQRRLEDLFADTAGALANPLLHGHRRPRRIAKARVAAAGAALAAVVVAAISIAVVAGSGPSDGPHVTVAEGVDPGSPGAAEQEIVESTILATKGEEHVVHRFEGGVRASLSGDGRAQVNRASEHSYTIWLDEGLIVVEVPETEPRTHLSVEAENIRVTVKGTLFSVRARSKQITDVSVERGAVEVLSKLSNEKRMVHAGESLSVESLLVRALGEQTPSLVAMFNVETEDEEVVPGPAAPGKDPKGSFNAKVKHVVEESKPLSPYELAMELRKEGRYEEAVEAFLSASQSSKGLEKERCLFQAANLSLNQLDNPQKAILLSQSYLNQYSSGFYTEEAYILQARAHMKVKEFEKARAVLMGYIDAYPQGSQQDLAHLLIGKIFATTYGNCKAAIPHLEFVVSGKSDGPTAQQAAKILDYCKEQ